MSTNNTDSTNSEYPLLNDALQNHLTGCAQCQMGTEMGTPVPNLNKSGKVPLCQEWFRIISDYAQHEGQVNNIVARDEYGNEAWHHE